jgi:hypothetical protein
LVDFRPITKQLRCFGAACIFLFHQNFTGERVTPDDAGLRLTQETTVNCCIQAPLTIKKKTAIEHLGIELFSPSVSHLSTRSEIQHITMLENDSSRMTGAGFLLSVFNRMVSIGTFFLFLVHLFLRII